MGFPYWVAGVGFTLVIIALVVALVVAPMTLPSFDRNGHGVADDPADGDDAAAGAFACNPLLKPCGPWLAAPNPPRPTATPQAAPPTGVNPAPGQLTFELQGSTRKGVLDTARFGGLGCTLHALAPRRFVVDGPCNGEYIQRFQAEFGDGRVEFQTDRVAVVIPEFQRQPRLTRLEVALPLGQPPSGCRLTAVYSPLDGAQRQRLSLTPLVAPAGEPAVFAADFGASPPAVHRGQVAVEIAVNSARRCGAPGRHLSLAVADGEDGILRTALSPAALDRAQVVYAPLFHGVELAALYDTTARRIQLGEAMLLAVESAHRRLATGPEDRPWTLWRAHAVAVSRREGPELLVSLNNPTALSHDLDRAFGDGLDRAPLHRLAQGSSAFAAADFATALGLTLADPPLERLVLVLLGWGTGDRAPCDTLKLDNLHRALSEAMAPALRIVAFPLLTPSPDRRAELAHQVMPIQFKPNTRDLLLGQVVACRSNRRAVQVFPFMRQPWYSAEETTLRYGAAVGDQLGAVLEDIAFPP